MIHRAVSSLLLAGALALLAQGERLKATGTFDGDPFSVYAAVLVLASLLLSSGSARAYGVSLAFILVISTRNLLLVAFALAAVALLLAGRRAYGVLALMASLVVIGHVDLAALEDPSSLGIALFVLGLLATWLAIHRAVVTRETYSPGESIHISFSALVAVTVVALRLAAWLPDVVGLERALGLAALFFLSLGALGVFFAVDRRNLARWSLVAQAGLLGASCLGGVEARPFVLAQLVVAGVAIHFVAHARDRLTLGVGALALFSPPPFPGFALLLAASSAVIAEGHSALLIALVPAHILLGAGALRYLWKRHETWDGELVSGSALPSATPLGVGLAVAAMLLLGVWVEPLIELARLAAAGLF